MNRNFYNSKLTFITPTKYEGDLPSYYVPFYGELEEVVHKVKWYEYNNDTFFNGHLIVNDFEYYNEINTTYDLKSVAEKWLEPDISLFYQVIHEHQARECSVDMKLALVSSYALPIIGYASRTENSVYANCWRHRIRMFNFDYLADDVKDEVVETNVKLI